MHTATPPLDASVRDFNLQKCIDALARGECTEDQFLSDTVDVRDSDSNSVWDVLAYIDQRYRRGQLAEPIFQSIKSRIARRALNTGRDGNTIELDFACPSARAADNNKTDSLDPALPAPPRAPRPAIRIGQILRNRYVVESLLGCGGMGDVFKAADGLSAVRVASPSHVAIKVYRESVEHRPDLMARLQREFDSTRKLAHSNVVQVYDFDCSDQFAFYTMEYLDGDNVADLIARKDRRALSASSVWSIIGSVGGALAHAHSRNVIHGDVSPKNIMLTRSGEVRVLDFGSSTTSVKDLTPEAAAKGSVAATPAYASCELLEGQTADPRDDLYSLACVAYELLTGEHPFQGRRATEARDMGLKPRRPTVLSSSRWRVLLHGLAWTRERRSLSISQWLVQMGFTLPGEPAAVLPTPVAIAPQPMALQTVALNSTLPKPLSAKSLSAKPILSVPARTGPPGKPWVGRGLALSLAAIAVVALCALSLSWLDSSGDQSANDTEEGAPAAAAPADFGSLHKPKSPDAMRPITLPPVTLPPIAAPTVAAPRAVIATPTLVAALGGSANAPANLKFAVNRYVARRGAHFVESRVWRLHASTGTREFVWWTTEGSAKAGADYVPQAPTHYNFAQGRQLASLFVRLVPNHARRHDADFRICMGKPAINGTLSNVTCSSVLVPADSDR